MRTTTAGPLLACSLVMAGCGACGDEEAAPDAGVDPATRALALIPLPQQGVGTGGALHLSASSRVAVSAEAEGVGELLADVLRPSTGFEIPVVVADQGDIVLRLAPTRTDLGEEGYALEVTESAAVIEAAELAGLFYGCQTLRQLLPPEVESATVVAGVDWMIPGVSIEDYPRYAWRGFMLDVARHFFSVGEVMLLIDLAAFHKLNRLHLHLTDDQGWRIEIESWPLLSTIGGSTEVGGGPGGYYSQGDYQTIVEYARARFVTVVPEIDFPGHCNAALASYGELNESGEPAEPYTGTDVGFSSLWLDGPDTLAFVEDVLGEVAALTPGAYMHIGGDEAYETDPAAYGTFLATVQGISAEHGKELVGWEEINTADLTPPFAAQFWLLPYRAVAAADKGARVIASPSAYAYLNMQYAEGTPPYASDWGGPVSVEKAYRWDPVILELEAAVPPLVEENILGVEAALWTETVESYAQLVFVAFPRLVGHAEIAWSSPHQRNWEEYRVRLARHGARLDFLAPGYYRSPLVPWLED